MAAINQYNIMRDENLRKVDKIFYLTQEADGIINSDSIDSDRITKYKRNLYIFLENILCNNDEDGSFTIRGEDVNSLSDLYGRLEDLRSFLRNNYDNIVTNK